MAPATGARRTITTDDSGRYVFSFLSPGDYDVSAELNGFQPVTRTGVSLNSGSRITPVRRSATSCHLPPATCPLIN